MSSSSPNPDSPTASSDGIESESGRSRLLHSLDPEQFRRDGHELIDRIANHLTSMRDREGPVLPTSDPSSMVSEWYQRLEGVDEATRADHVGYLDEVIARSNHLLHPRCVGHQVSAVLPSTGLTEMVAALLNNGMAVYETGPVSTALEIASLRWLAARIGWNQQASGVLTSGGSLGNLTALLAARQAKAGFDVWSEGSNDHKLAVVVSEQAHYCVARAAKVMGWGSGGVVTAKVDERFRMTRASAEAALARAERDHRQVIALVASACSTATGSFDPIPELADLCEQRGLWLHVDGAHGASSLLSPQHRHLVEGIDRADSVVWDAHKMMLVPALITAVLFRDGVRSYESFAQQASYLFGGNNAQEEWFNLGMRTMECTKRMMSLQLYGVIRQLGEEGLGAFVSSRYELAKQFAATIRASDDFELAIEPQCNIVCFRHRAPGLEGVALDQHQLDLRRRLIESGEFYVVQTRLPKGLFLRTTIINPRTTLDDLDHLLDCLRAESA
ncbi:MAG: aminotransferase class I/II-fold pyridoxal phosphate-dependent enzyme [Polyangiaceae bacterium]